MKKLYLLAIIALVSCAGSKYQIVEVTDQYNQTRTYVQKGNLIKHVGGQFAMIEFSFFAMQPQAKDTLVYGCQIKTASNDWIFADRAVFLIDGKPHPMKVVDRNTDVKGGMCFESLMFLQAPKEIKRIASAKRLSIKIEGDNRYTEAVFTEVNKERLQDFASRM